MLRASVKAAELQQIQNHMNERPVALLTQLTANVNRDHKKNTKGHGIEEFFFYQPRKMQNIPEARFGAAAIALIAMGKLPSWALFCYKELATAAAGPPPKLLAYIGEGVVLLAPIKKNKHVTGMMIAMESAQNKRLVLTSPCGDSITVKIPPLHTKVVAEEDVMLPLY